MDTMSPQQQESLSRSRTLAGETKTSAGQYENKRRMKSYSHRRQSAPSLVFSKALTRSRTVSRENFLVPLCPETCPLVESFLTPGRVFLLHAQAQLKTGLQTQDRHLFLFTDILVIAKAKSPTHFKLKAQAFVCEMWTHTGCMEEVCEGSTSPEKSFVMGWPTCNCVATFSFVEQKERWLSLLKSRVKEEKEKEDPKTIPLKVFGKGIGNCTLEKTLAVTNADPTTEVVRLALQQFGITGCVKDYQLWVNSKRENAPYPLIGHEFPFSIYMSHERDLLTQAGRGCRDATPPIDRQRMAHTEQTQLQANKQCQFILKHRCVTATPHPVMDTPQKPIKRRRSLINWAFWRGSNPQLHDLSISLSCPAPGFLFGQSLSSVCLGDALPKPVMDMLVFLYHEGSFTRGIFRRSAGARACREFRDRLDYGAQDLLFTREHIFIVAAVFKDFLRNIPGSLLCSDLYEEWMDVMEEAHGVEDEQAQVLQRLIARLPKQNALLLRYVVAVLHGIQGNAHDNQMNAFNLSVCIAPSMLWAPGPSSPEVEGEGAKKVCDLVRFMIEHCQQVLGEDVTTLFGGPPQKGTVSEHEPDVSTFNLTDSSYDSLENELNEDSSEYPGRRRRGRRRVKARQGSLDSVLTLSDYDLDQREIDTDPNTTTQPGNRSPHGTNTIPQSGEPNHHFLQLPALARPRTRRRSPASPAHSPASPHPAAPRGGTKASHPPLSVGGHRRERRSSEPTIGFSAAGLVARLVRNVDQAGSFENLSGDEVYKGGVVHTASRSRGACEGSGLGGATSLALCVSSSSLSSPSNSPTPTRASFNSLDSLLSPFTDHRNPTRHPSAKLPPSSAPLLYPSSPPLNPSISTPSPPASTHCPAPAPAPAPTVEPCPKGAPPIEALSWGSLNSSKGLHPNTWLKRGQRLSLQLQENAEGEEEESGVVRSNDQTLLASKSVQEKAGVVRQASADLTLASMVISPSNGGGQEMAGVSQEQGLLAPRQGKVSPLSKQRSLGHIQDSSRSPSSEPSERPLTVRELREIHNNACLQHKHGIAGSGATTQGRLAGSEVCEPKRPSQGVSYERSKPSLSMYRQKSHSLTPAIRGPSEGLHRDGLPKRRASEPAAVHLGEALVLERVLHIERLHREAKQGQSMNGDHRVRISNVEPQCGQSLKSMEARFSLCPSVLVKRVKDYFLSHRCNNSQCCQGWARGRGRGSGGAVMVEPDFDKLLFAEESHV